MNASTDTGAPSSGYWAASTAASAVHSTRPALIRTLGPHTGNVQRGGGAGSTGQACQRRRRTGRVASRPMAATTIGWREWVGLPGARRRVGQGQGRHRRPLVDAARLGRRVDEGPRRPPCGFAVHPFQHDDDSPSPRSPRCVDVREFRSSNGDAERRPVIRTPVVIGGRAADRAEPDQPRRDGLPDAARPHGAAPPVPGRPGPLVPGRGQDSRPARRSSARCRRTGWLSDLAA